MARHLGFSILKFAVFVAELGNTLPRRMRLNIICFLLRFTLSCPEYSFLTGKSDSKLVPHNILLPEYWII